jgi:2-succinyl-5-enolpyruvyl-6-hydroxy-3-cyclohexene-1-carboxylate synthase
MTSSAAATFCATLVDEWVSAGLSAAMIAPGSRSTPMAMALAGHPGVHVEVFHDERSAAFAALGFGLVRGTPAVVLCSSGTAGTHFHGAVVEADLSGVPMLVLTADRPAELHDVGAAQTIDQTRLFGSAVRWFHEPGVPSAEAARSWRSLARRAYRAAVDHHPGPVHLNLAFREPLVGEPGPLPDGQTGTIVGSRPHLDVRELDQLAGRLDRHRGLIVAGRGAGESGSDVEAVAALARATDWPILADPRSRCRHLDGAVSAADALLRHRGFAQDHTPEVVLHIGEPWASRVVNEWLAGSGAFHVHLSASGRPVDPGLVVSAWLGGPVGLVCTALADKVRGASGTTWAPRWRHAEALAQASLEATLASQDHLSEPAVARAVVDTLGALEVPSQLVVSSSMPIRDVEWYTRPVADLAVLSNRGANGIDGVVATAIGAAVANPQAHTAVLIGDVAVLHDASSLTALTRRGLNLRLVVVDNDGGGIFSFLSQASAVPADRFEQLWGTPHGTDLAALFGAHGLDVEQVGDVAGLADALGRPGTGVVLVRSERAANVAVHEALHRGVQVALG